MSRCESSHFHHVFLRSIFNKKPIFFKFDTTADLESQKTEYENFFKTLEFVRKVSPACSGMNILPDDTSSVKDLHSIIKICEKYNNYIKTITALEKGTSLAHSKAPVRYASKELYHHILQLCYERAVKNPTKLNRYGPFSPQVYGETSFEFICLIIDSLTITKDDVFLDLGSGVGQVVLQMAALTPCKLSIGLEKNSVPSLFAENLAAYFHEWMRWFGKSYNPVKLLEADFLDADSLEHFNNATIIFVNNVAFGPEINHQLTLRFQNLRDGVRIISPVPFCREKFRITGRSLNNIASIMSMVDVPQLRGPVSWTSKSVSYYVHVIDRRKLEAFFLDSRRDETPEKSRKRYQRAEVLSGSSNSISVPDSEIHAVCCDELSNDEESATKWDRDEDEKKSTVDEEESRTVKKLNILLDSYANDFMQMVNQIKQKSYKESIYDQIEKEKQYQQKLKQNMENITIEIRDLEVQSTMLLNRRWEQIYEDIANYPVKTEIPETAE